MKKILPFEHLTSNFSPPLTTVLSILSTRKETKPWLVNNLLNIVISQENSEESLNDFFRTSEFFDCQPLLEYRFPYAIIDTLDYSLSEIIAFLLTKNYYVYGMFNRKHFSALKNDNSIHNMLFYGVNELENTFYFCDFSPLDTVIGAQLKHFECSASELDLAINDFNIRSKTSNYKRNEDSIIALKPREVINCEFSLTDLKQSINLFLESKNLYSLQIGKPIQTQYKFIPFSEKDSYIFGINCYDNISKFVLEDKIDNLKQLALLREYAAFWDIRIDILNELGIFPDQSIFLKLKQTIQIISRDSNICVLSYLKLKLSKNYSIDKKKHQLEKIACSVIQQKVNMLLLLDTLSQNI
ncbi:hypothetical protein DOK67_0000380 [Enterococcus sp. DIV0212c]|uniref:hypothetical protein n=1 Tax=Enterococcus sp. DIV0212c TaxID=2230867 RepID=UPI001A9B0D1A|nr:hypothetical protein [Enterococcus sp. DIV0212c]MBO1352931.1 hypothetical protein [Enterococcus sp. DIV0212c]